VGQVAKPNTNGEAMMMLISKGKVMLNPTTQFLMEVGRDVDAQNTFERDMTLTLRLAKFF
jgi:hypothetical protein